MALDNPFSLIDSVPNMGANYQTLAQLTQPQMMGNAPIGAGGLAGQLYGQDIARHDAMIQGAQGLAQMDAQIKGQQSSEYFQGAPGRGAQIDTENQLAQGRLGTVDDQNRTYAAQQMTARIQAEMGKLAPYANEAAQATSSNELKDIKEKMKADGIRKIGNMNIDDIPDDKFKEAMQRSRAMQVNTPAVAGKIKEIEATGDWRERVERQRAMWHLEAKTIEMKVRKEIAEMTTKQREAMGDPDKLIYHRIAAQAGEQAAIIWYDQTKNERARAGAANQPSQIDIDQSNLPAGVTVRKPQTPQAIPPPISGGPQQPQPQAQPTPEAQAGHEPIPEKEAQAVFDGLPAAQKPAARQYFRKHYGHDPK